MLSNKASNKMGKISGHKQNSFFISPECLTATA